MAATGTGTEMGASALLRLQSWLSPAFPVGGFSYSHGLEFAREAGLVGDRASVADWLDADLRHGGGRCDAVLFVAAMRGPPSDIIAIAELAAAARGARELALESTGQGEAFLDTVARVWPTPALTACRSDLAAAGIPAALPVAVALCCRAHGIAAETALPLYLQAVVANAVSAAVRLIPLGQTDGQRILAGLEGALAETAAAALSSTLDDLGSAALVVDWASMRHETQYTRLFRS